MLDYKNRYIAAKCFFSTLRKQAENLVLPYCSAIYEIDDLERPTQIGTALRVSHEGRTFLVTARHTLYGHDFDEDAGAKAALLTGRLDYLSNLVSGEIAHPKHRDVCCVPIRSDLPSLSIDVFQKSQYRGDRLSVFGYLVRDFKRHKAEERLSPKPFLFTEKRIDRPDDLIGMRYTGHKNRDSRSGMKVQSPIPKGLSGGPMLDSDRLAAGEVSVVGVFTDKPFGKGEAFGEPASLVHAMIQEA